VGGVDQLAALQPVYERVYGAEHPETLTLRAHMAVQMKEEDVTAARDEFLTLLPVVERVLGAEHPLTVASRYHIAFLTEAVGDADGARDQFRAMLPVLERVLGAEHPLTVSARSRMGTSPNSGPDDAVRA
jgi:Tetratricopeptide repeat